MSAKKIKQARRQAKKMTQEVKKDFRIETKVEMPCTHQVLLKINSNFHKCKKCKIYFFFPFSIQFEPERIGPWLEPVIADAKKTDLLILQKEIKEMKADGLSEEKIKEIIRDRRLYHQDERVKS